MLVFTCGRSLLQVEMLTLKEVAVLLSLVQGTWGGCLCVGLAVGMLLEEGTESSAVNRLEPEGRKVFWDEVSKWLL